MKLHERHFITQDAKLDLMKAIAEVRKKHDLTEAEWIQLIASEMSSEIISVTKYQIRMERHGDYDTPGALENG